MLAVMGKFSDVGTTSHSQFQRSYIDMHSLLPVKVIAHFCLFWAGEDATWVFRNICPSSAALRLHCGSPLG